VVWQGKREEKGWTRQSSIQALALTADASMFKMLWAACCHCMTFKTWNICSDGMQGKWQGKGAHLLQHACSEAQHVERGKDVTEGTIELPADERGGIEEVFVIFDSKQNKK
jgi:hypothetical protein